MQNVVTSQPEYLKVEFYPTLDNFVHVSQRFQRSLPKYKTAQWAYQAFVVINGFIFPAYLFLNDRYAWAFAIFFVTVVIWAVLVPILGKSANRTYFGDMLGDVGSIASTCEINSWGVACLREGNAYSVPWQNIKNIEQTDDAIYFFFGHNGIFVNDTGFATPSERADFYKFALAKWKQSQR